MRYAWMFCLLASPATAACLADEQVFLTCQIAESRKTLSVCYDDTLAYYRFGVAGQVPELALTRPIGNLDYRPWSGIGKDIWEEIRFRVGRYEYKVYAGFERPWGDELPEDKPHRYFGAVSVALDDEVLITLDCDRATTQYDWVDDLYRAKVAWGLEWDDIARSWVARGD